MKSPFDELFEQQTVPEFEDVSGAFSCQRCDRIVGEAKYNEEAMLLTWKCEEGHISKIEGFTA